MAAVDRLGWTAGLAFTAYGASVGIRTNDAAAMAQLHTVLPPAWTPVDGPVVDSLFSVWVAPPATGKGRRNYHLVYSAAGRVARTLDLAEALARLEDALRITVAYWARKEYLFVHAGVVGWQGRAIVLPGRSHSGKSTVVVESAPP